MQTTETEVNTHQNYINIRTRLNLAKTKLCPSMIDGICKLINCQFAHK